MNDKEVLELDSCESNGSIVLDQNKRLVLIEQVELVPAIWNPSDRHHSKQSIKQLRWMDIADFLCKNKEFSTKRRVQFSGCKKLNDILYKTWRNLTITFNTIKRKSKTASGISGDEMEVAINWPFWNSLQFLLTVNLHNNVNDRLSNVPGMQQENDAENYDLNFESPGKKRAKIDREGKLELKETVLSTVAKLNSEAAQTSLSKDVAEMQKKLITRDPKLEFNYRRQIKKLNDDYEEKLFE